MNRELLKVYTVPATWVVGAVMLTGCQTPPRHEPRWEAGQVTEATPTPSEAPLPTAVAKTPKEAACLDLVEAGAKIAPAECVALPVIGKDVAPIKAPSESLKACERDPESKLLGRIAGTNIEGNMSEVHKQALASAAQDPVAGELLEYADEVLIYSMSGGNEAAVYKGDDIQLCMDEGDSTIFGTPAGVRAVMTHEGAHAAYEKLESLAKVNTAQGKAIKEELATFKDLSIQEFTYIAEQFRIKHGEDAVAALQIVRSRLDPADTAYIAAVDELSQRFKIQDGLATALVDEMGYLNPIEGTLYTAIDVLAVKHGYKGEARLENKDISVADWSILDMKVFPDHVSQNLSYMLESVILRSISSENAGHPTNITEQVASLIATTTLHPEAVYEAARNLPFAQRKMAMKKLASLQRLINELNPELAEHLQLGDIAMHLELEIIAEEAAARRSLTIALRSEIDSGIQLTGGDWRNLPASAARVYV